MRGVARTVTCIGQALEFDSIESEVPVWESRLANYNSRTILAVIFVIDDASFA